MDRIGIGLVGFGTVGQAVVEQLLQDSRLLTDKTGLQFDLRHVIDTDLDRSRDVAVPPELLSDDLDRLLKDPQTTIAVELVGGTTAAKQIVSGCLQAGKHVVTANKALLATHGRELFDQARKQHASDED